ncbi:MAG: hypothetical protein WDM94_09920 [Bauldia sp.]
MDEFYERFGPIMHSLEGWTRAGVIRDLAKTRFLALTIEDDGIRHHRHGNATSFSVGRFNLRIKKLSAKLRARTNRTTASKNFDRNQGTMLLDDQPSTNLYFGYAPTENDPQHPPMYLVCNDEKGKQAWEPIPVVLAGAAVTEITPKEETKPSGRVRAKRDKKREAGNG